MATSSKQKLKTLSLLRILETGTDSEQGLTMPQIIDRLEGQGIAAERKSIYRDLAALRECGYDIVKLPTRPVQYALRRSRLDFDDVMMLIDAVQSSRFLTERQSDQLVRGLKGLVSDRERQQLEKRVHVRGRIKNRSESVFHSVDLIHEALQRKRKIEFLYFSYDTDLKRRPRHDGKRYGITPVKVVYSDGNYYLAGYDDGDAMIKTYRIDRMELLQVSDEAATRCPQIANYEYDDFSYASFSMFHGQPVTVTLRVKAPLMDAVVDRFGSEVSVAKATEDHADVRVAVQVSPQFYGWVAGLDGGVAIQAPKRVAADYRAWLSALAEG